jgi:hypothetical protein
MKKIDGIPKCKDDPFQAIHRMGDKINELVDSLNDLNQEVDYQHQTLLMLKPEPSKGFDKEWDRQPRKEPIHNPCPPCSTCMKLALDCPVSSCEYYEKDEKAPEYPDTQLHDYKDLKERGGEGFDTVKKPRRSKPVQKETSVKDELAENKFPFSLEDTLWQVAGKTDIPHEEYIKALAEEARAWAVRVADKTVIDWSTDKKLYFFDELIKRLREG